MPQLLLDLADQLLTLLIDGILSVEKLSTHAVAASFEIAQLFLVEKLVLQ